MTLRLALRRCGSRCPRPVHGSVSLFSTTVDPKERSKFAAYGSTWWDGAGGAEPLHKMNPCRIRFIERYVGRHFGISDINAKKPLGGLRVADIGCGGGILSESLARCGAAVVGVDPAPENIAVATAHAKRDPEA